MKEQKLVSAVFHDIWQMQIVSIASIMQCPLKFTRNMWNLNDAIIAWIPAAVVV